MARNTKISVLSIRPDIFKANIGDYAAYEKQIKEHLKRNIDKVLPECPDIILLPENCIRFGRYDWQIPEGFSVVDDNKEYYKYLGNRMVEFLGEIARDNNTYIAYSATRYIPEDEKFHFRNSTVYIDRKGGIAGIYDKNHLVVEENTKNNIAYGTEAKAFDLDFGRVASAICFDLNFNELMEKYKPQHPDLIVFCSAYHGGLKQEHWAYECQSYFAGAISGAPGRILNPFGETVASATNYTDHVSAMVNLDYRLCHIDYNWAKFTAAKEKYKTALTIHDPGLVGSVMLTYNDTDKTVEDVIDEFEIERLDDYFARARAHRAEHI